MITAEKAREIRDKWLQVCPSCDAGLPLACTHPDEDPRPVISELVVDVIAQAEQIADLQSRLDGQAWADLQAEVADLRAREERIRAAAWDEGEAAGWSRANRKWSDEPLVERAENPYRAALEGVEPEEAEPAGGWGIDLTEQEFADFQAALAEIRGKDQP